MSRLVDLGIFAESGKPFRGDLEIILRSNVLLQANSGGGKSWALRRCIEQAFKRVPQIIIDPEGEFSTLREKFDVVLVGKGGDTPADIRSAKLLAHRLLELGASAVIDLYEMSKTQRPVWVAAFVGALVDAPKKLWRDLFIYIDEAHEFAPEPGHGSESRDEKLCRHALIDLAAKGRKRGYGVIAATQRLGKLSKDFAAELKNVLIGQTFIDIDRERAAGSLGVVKANKPEFFRDVMKLEPGAFFAFGRAFSLESILVTIGDVQTEHPEAGRRQSAPPPPTEKIRHLLPQLADLPKEAEQKIQTEKELKARIAELERAALVLRWPVAKDVKIVEKSVLKPEHLVRLEKLVEKVGSVESQFSSVQAQWVDRLLKAQTPLIAAIKELGAAVKMARTPASVPSTTVTTVTNGRLFVPAKVVERKVVMDEPGADDFTSLSRCARALLGVLAQRGVATDSQISALSGYRKTSSGFANSLSELRTKGLIDGPPERRVITATGRSAVGWVEALPSGPALLDYWVRKLGRAEAAMLKVIYGHGTVDRETISKETGYSITSSGFANSISGLRVLDLVSGPNGGDLTIADVFKE